MCLGSSSEKSPSATFYYPKRSSKRPKVQVHRLTSRRRITCCEEELGSVDMELMNLKLYLENQTIIEENKKLRKTASLLHKENLALFSELQKKFSINNNNLDH